MKFCWSTLTVRNLDESLQFYQEIVGLKLMKRYRSSSGLEIAFLGEGETQIELIQSTEDREIDVGKDIAWGFEVDSMEECMEFVQKKGVPIASGPFQPNPNIRFFYVNDPNGLIIQFVENM